MSDVQPEVAPVAPAPEAPVAPVGPADSFSGLTVNARRSADTGQWIFSVTMGGAEIDLYAKKLGGVDDDLQEAATPGFKKKRADDYRRDLLGNG